MGYLRVPQEMSSFKPLSGRVSVRLFGFKGTVVAHRKWSETETFSQTTVYAAGVGGKAGVVAGPRVQSIVTEIHEFFLRDGDDEIAVTLHNANFAIRPGNEVGVAWIVRSDQQKGPYIWAHNYTTNQTVDLPPNDGFILGAEYRFPKLSTSLQFLLFAVAFFASAPIAVYTDNAIAISVALVLCGMSVWRIAHLIQIKKMFLSRFKEKLATIRDAAAQIALPKETARQEAPAE